MVFKLQIVSLFYFRNVGLQKEFRSLTRIKHVTDIYSKLRILLNKFTGKFVGRGMSKMYKRNFCGLAEIILQQFPSYNSEHLSTTKESKCNNLETYLSDNHLQKIVI